MSEELTLRYIPLAQAKRWDRNPKKHDIGAICRSIELHGFRDPPAYDAALDAFVEGNGRTDALEALWQQKRPAPRGILALEDGGWAMPVIFGVDAVSRAAAEAYGVDHNNLTLSGGDFTAFDMAKLWNEEDYTTLLSDLAALDVMPISVDGDDLDALLGGMLNEGAGGDDFDAAPEDGPTRTQAGDLWVIGGKHRLVVGDSTDPATVARLMGGERADILWTDPPYSVAYEGKTVDALTIENDALSPEELRRFLVRALVAADKAMHEGAGYYIAHPDIFAYEFIGAVRDVGWRQARPAVVLWVKNTMVMGRGDYHSRSEPILYGWKPGAAHHAVEDRTQDNVWEIDRPQASVDHPTMKPVELVERALRNSTEPDAIALDLFGGSGTTLVAAHRTGRRAYLCELSPRYADVILRRAEAEGLTCEKAE